MRFIYTDEAGISAKEPVSVTAGVIVDADSQWRRAEASLHAIYDAHVPAQYRSNFIFHATEVFSGGKRIDRAVWPLEARFNLLLSVVALPRMLGIGICVGKVRRDAQYPSPVPGITPLQWQHIESLFYCLQAADGWVRDNCAPNEIATVVSEDTAELKGLIKVVATVLREIRFEHADPTSSIPTKLEKALGVSLHAAESKVTRIVDCVHLAEKKHAILLQLADACAFSFRRFFAELPRGEELVAAMLGRALEIEDWLGPASGAAFGGDVGSVPTALQSRID